MTSMEEIHVDIRPHIAAVARPGDTILIGFNVEMTDEDVEVMEENFKPLIEMGIEVGFLDSVSSIVVIKGKEGD